MQASCTRRFLPSAQTLPAEADGGCRGCGDVAARVIGEDTNPRPQASDPRRRNRVISVLTTLLICDCWSSPAQPQPPRHP